AGYQIMLAESQHRVEQEEKLLETLLASNIAAAILLSVEHSTTVRQWLKNASIPVMEMGAIRSDPIDMNIGIDNVAAMYELTEMLIQRGYQNIGLLCANQEQWIFQQHLHGWYKAMLRHHMSPNRVINAALPPNFSTGASQLPEFLLAWPELDALVCVSDELACGALYECQRRRIKVPDDLAVVGFGDSDVSRVCQPPLTTMAVPHRKIGSEAGRALLERLNQGNWSDRKSIASSLCMRESC
ncbi:substrate-binding domain-containing protein, partial [Salmonella enterica subsp. enterica serovar Kentucky]|nr:substrate-binding domain-containing protein [Salmonella enterica subsp. enterica serovar Kentucky]